MQNNNIVAQYKYIYDPSHTNKPNGGWNRTNSGWSLKNDSSVSKQKPHKVKKYNPPALSKHHKENKEKDKIEENLDQDIDLNETIQSNDEMDMDIDNIDLNEQSVEKDQKENVDNIDLNEQDVDSNEQEESSEQETDSNEQESVDDIDLNETNDQSEGKEYLDENKFDEYIEKMNKFVDVFDSEEGQKNKITFKAVASNIEWDDKNVVDKFREHCERQNIENCSDVINFLYYQYNNDQKKFEQILEKMN